MRPFPKVVVVAVGYVVSFLLAFAAGDAMLFVSVSGLAGLVPRR